MIVRRKSGLAALAAAVAAGFVLGGGAAPAAPLRVACVGDSITHGVGASSPFQSYPSQLGRMLGDGWEVVDFGKSGRAVLRNSNSPYAMTDGLAKALAFKPDVVVIQLGTNDTKAPNWKFKDQFAADYKDLIAPFQALPEKPRIFLCRPPFIAGPNKYGIDAANLAEEIPMIDAVAREEGLPEIDNFAATQGRGELFPDAVHPDDAGAGVLAGTVYAALVGKPFAGEVPAFSRGAWNGFEQRSFAVGDRACFLVFPKSPLAGNPWVWRTDLPGVDAQADAALLAKGYHLAYVNVANLYGAPGALDRMDEFYDVLRAEYHLAPRAVLEAVSGGGFAAFNWAARRPDRVAAIWADGAALDFNSWPAGKKDGKGSPADWTRLLLAYGLTADEASDFRDNPVDDLAPLARAEIPILGIYGEADPDCVPEENIVLAARRYRELGGKITLIPKAGVGHRPLGLADPAPIVDFVAASSSTP